ncbi:alanine racemase [Thioclava sp. GXIMD4215]|uniref:alanine racemase n=1 Tax=Thioclava sp. GXIMD4215 TaxID=3131928 RepID=UPI003245AD48
MASSLLHIDLDAIASNWKALDAKSGPATQTAAVVKADSYGLGADRVARTLLRQGAKTFFVALAEEGAKLRQAIGDGPEIFILSGHMAGDCDMIADLDLTPVLNSPEQVKRHMDVLPEATFGIQLDTGMNRLGLEDADWRALAPSLLEKSPSLIMSHLACSDEPHTGMNERQLAEFTRMTDGTGLRRSLSATGGLLYGKDYHFDLVRPGIGLYGGRPYIDATPVVTLSLPVIQTRIVEAGETVGYGNTWQAERRSHVATVSAGYADGISRRLSNNATLWAGDTACPLIGRVSMDLITVDITDLDGTPEEMDLLNAHQGVDALADLIGTIGYEVLTSLGARYQRRYSETLG